MTTITDSIVLFAVDRLFQQPGVHPIMERLRRRLPDSAEIAVAGGALRNIVIDTLHGEAPHTQDIDLFIGGVKRHFALSAVFSDERTEPTGLKGLRWYPADSPFVFDLCLLPNFVVIKTFHLGPTLQSLLAGIDFTVNAIIYDYKRQTLTEKGCMAAVRDRLIDFNSHLIPGKCLIAYRSLVIGHKTGFNFAEPVYRFLKDQLDPETLTQLKRVLRAKLGKAMAASILCDYDALCRTHSYDHYLTMRTQ
ncbi:hypothetical protein [Desulfosarcina ovata]|uniref:Poly A polymerase head domain-containing protein n=1 Tax=Desulfosarcina ovata subsp. ovata TaxID=2752305 RepID=A0A5K8AH94_9BACT|nr:hypothetical protein [Desulfosarcina ovata]BBO92001.1 hypothetical protein DSCOOX_51810 [Desulfosarcina ovata subsp. ovata]